MASDVLKVLDGFSQLLSLVFSGTETSVSLAKLSGDVFLRLSRLFALVLVVLDDLLVLLQLLVVLVLEFLVTTLFSSIFRIAIITVPSIPNTGR